MADTWTKVPPNYESQQGDVYRITIGIRSPYDVKTVNKIISALKTGEALNDTAGAYLKMLDTWSIDDIYTENDAHPDSVPYSAGNWEEWRLIIVGRRFKGGTPIAIPVAAILAVLALLVTLCFVTGWVVEKLNKGPIGTAIGDVGHAVGQAFPAIILGAFVIGLLIYTRKGATT